MWEVPPLRFFAICRDVPPTSVARVPPEAWNGGSVHAPSQWLPLELEAPRSPARNSAAEPHNRPPVDAPRTSDPRSLRFSFPQLAKLARLGRRRPPLPVQHSPSDLDAPPAAQRWKCPRRFHPNADRGDRSRLSRADSASH